MGPFYLSPFQIWQPPTSDNCFRHAFLNKNNTSMIAFWNICLRAPKKHQTLFFAWWSFYRGDNILLLLAKRLQINCISKTEPLKMTKRMIYEGSSNIIIAVIWILIFQFLKMNRSWQDYLYSIYYSYYK